MREKIRDLPLAVKASIAFLFASVVTKGISYITTPIYTRMLTAEEFGQVSIFLTWYQLFGIIAMFCLSYGIFNNGMVDYPQKRNEFSLSMLVLSNVITLIFSAVILISYPLLHNEIKLNSSLIIFMCIIFFFQPAYDLWYTRQRYELKYKSVVIWTLVAASLSTLISIITMSFFNRGNRLYPRIFGMEGTLIVIYIIFYIYQFKRAKCKVTTIYWKEAILFNLPLIPHYLSTYLLGSSDKIMIANIVGDSATAFYSVAYSVGSVATIVWAAINASLVPYTYEKCKEKKYSDISKITLPIVTFFAICCLSVILFAPEVVKIIATQEYMEAIYVIPPVVGGVFFQVQYFVFTNIIYYYKKTKYVMFASITAVVINIFLNYLFIPKYGYIVAGYTTLISYLIQAIMDYFAMKKVVGEKVYNIKYLTLLSLLVLIISIFSNLIYPYVYIRFGLLFVFMVIAIMKRKNIVKLFRNMKVN